MCAKNSDIGKQCLVWFNDTGRNEGMIIDVDKTTASVFLFADKTVRNVEFSQILEINSMVKPTVIELL